MKKKVVKKTRQPSKVKKYEKNKMYYIVWLDHSSGYGDGWTHESHIDYKDFTCETAGFLVNETDSCIFLTLSKYQDSPHYSNVMQILKNCIVSSKEVK